MPHAGEYQRAEVVVQNYFLATFGFGVGNIIRAKLISLNIEARKSINESFS